MQIEMFNMPLRHLGRNGPLVSSVGFGAMGLSFGYGKVEDNEERFKVLDRALEVGSTFWDTSDACEFFFLVRGHQITDFIQMVTVKSF
jgi:hypothetical protein